MAGNLTDTAENLVMDWINGVGTPTRPTTSLQVALITTTTVSTDSTAGSEVSGGSYTRKNVTFTSSSSGASSNNADLTWTGMPACTVGGVEVWDSAGTPVRLWYGTLTANKTVNSGDTFTIATGDLDLTID